jgi:beta-galactosidase
VARTQPTTTVKIYSNADSVELLVNGVSLGSKKRANHIFEWTDVVLSKGNNTIDVRASRNGQQLVDHCEWNYSAAPSP